MKHFLWLSLLVVITSCKSGFEYNKTGFAKLEKEIVSKFGPDAYYTDVQAVNSEDGSMVMVSVTKDPASLKQQQWLLYPGGEWEQQADVSFTVEGGTPESYMFRLGREASASQLGSLLEQSTATLQQEQHITQPEFIKAAIRSDHKRTSKEDGIFYYVTLRDPGTQKDFLFKYDLKGTPVTVPGQP